jgi:hypothetical protein
MNIWMTIKDLVRGVLGSSEEGDMTRTYRPVRDWSVPLDQVLDQLPSEALDPPGVQRRRLTRGSKTLKPKRRYSPANKRAKVSTTKWGKGPK